MFSKDDSLARNDELVVTSDIYAYTKKVIFADL